MLSGLKKAVAVLCAITVMLTSGFAVFADTPELDAPNENTRTVHFSPGNGGSVTAMAGGKSISSGDSVIEGSEVEFIAIPQNGYAVKEWLRDGSAMYVSAPSSFVIDNLYSDTYIEVTFEQISSNTQDTSFEPIAFTGGFITLEDSYAMNIIDGDDERIKNTGLIQFDAGVGGSITAMVDGTAIVSGTFVPKGRSVVFTAAPQSGRKVNEWKANSKVVQSGMQSYTLPPVNGPVWVSVDFITAASLGETPRTTMAEISPFSSSFPRWAETTTAFLVKNSDNTMSYITASGSTVRVETADADGKTVSTKSVAYELPIFGAFYSGENYNFIAFGQTNNDENNNKEVIRIVKYDKSFNKLGSASIKGGEIITVVPFNSANARITEHGGTLILHASRKRYKSEDGLNHQSNLSIEVDIADMKVTYQGKAFTDNHVSHSFDQYVMHNGVQPVFLDHGDGYPRSVVLHRANDYDYFSEFDKATMFTIPGEIGANCTGVTVGGFGLSDKNYLAAITTIDHSKAKGYTNYTIEGLGLDQRDIVVCVLPKSFKSFATASQVNIGKYIGTDKIASTPKMLSKGDGTFILLWQEFSLTSAPGSYVAQTISGDGTVSGAAKRFSDVGEFYREFFNVRTLPASFSAAHGTVGTQSQATGVNVANASQWAQSSIAESLEKGFVASDLQGRYTQVINRQEFCKMAVLWIQYATGKDIETLLAEKGLNRNKNAFSDTSDSDILAAYALGITSGTGDGKFSPYGSFTREQAATMIQNTCRTIGADVSNPPSSSFVDMEGASSWAINGINYCYDKKIMQGTGNSNFSPKATYTIEQSIVTFNNIDRDRL